MSDRYPFPYGERYQDQFRFPQHPNQVSYARFHKKTGKETKSSDHKNNNNNNNKKKEEKREKQCTYGDQCHNYDCKHAHSKLRKYNFKLNKLNTIETACANVVQGLYSQYQTAHEMTAITQGSTFVTPHWTKMIQELSTSELKYFKSQRNAVLRTVFGTLEPKMNLKSAIVPISMAAGVLTADVVPIQWFSINSYTVWAQLFDEYRFFGKFSIHWVPFSVMATTSTALSPNQVYPLFIGVIDYDSSGSLLAVSIDGVLQYDTAMMFTMLPTQLEALYHPQASWKGHLQGQPDLAWVSTASNNIVAYHKTKNMSGYNANVSALGVYMFKSEIEFRQLN